MDAYLKNRTTYRDVSTNLNVLVGTDDTTLIAAKTNHTIYVQKIVGWITTDAAQSLTFQDSTTAKVIAKITTSPGAATRWDFDFGPNGVPLTVSEGLVVNMSAAGLIGHLVIDAYAKLTGSAGVVTVAQSAV